MSAHCDRESHSVPHGHWESAENRREYMDWLAEQLEFATDEDWYRITKSDFQAYGGGGLLANYYRDSPQAAVREYRPNYAWKPWLFSKVPQGYWQDPAHRRSFMDWLAEQLEFTRPEDWYRVRRSDFTRNGGGGLLANYYSHSIPSALQEYRPDIEWLPWRFGNVPPQFWHDERNRRRYVTWLGEQLGVRRAEDWQRVRPSDFQAHHGLTLLRQYYRGNRQRLLSELLPKRGKGRN